MNSIGSIISVVRQVMFWIGVVRDGFSLFEESFAEWNRLTLLGGFNTPEKISFLARCAVSIATFSGTVSRSYDLFRNHS